MTEAHKQQAMAEIDRLRDIADGGKVEHSMREEFLILSFSVNGVLMRAQTDDDNKGKFYGFYAELRNNTDNFIKLVKGAE